MNKVCFCLMVLISIIGTLAIADHPVANLKLQFDTQIPILFLVIYLLTPKNNIALKCVSLFMLLSYSFVLLKALLQYYFNVPSLPIQIARYIEIFLFIPFTIYQCTRKQIKSDPINNDNYMFVIKKPKSIRGFLVTLFYIPMESLSVYSNGFHYRMKKLKGNDENLSFFVRIISKYFSGMAGKQLMCQNKRDQYVLIDTRVKITTEITRELDKTVGSRWSFRNNCFRVYQNNLGSIRKILWNRLWQPNK